MFMDSLHSTWHQHSSFETLQKGSHGHQTDRTQSHMFLKDCTRSRLQHELTAQPRMSAGARESVEARSAPEWQCLRWTVVLKHLLCGMPRRWD